MPRSIDVEWVLETLQTSWVRVQLVPLSNPQTVMARFALMDVATRAIHSRIWNLRLQMVRAVFGKNDIGQLKRLLTEILVSHESLFHSQLMSVIVEQAKRASDWNKFDKVAKHCGLKKVLTVVGQVAKGHSSSFHSFKG